MKTFIFACIHNAGRSQMAAAFFNRMVDPKKAKAISAGTNPAKHVHPEVMIVMKEIGFDLSSASPTLLTEELARGANLLITMGCGEKCPFVPGLEVRDWKLDDPKGQNLDSVRKIRDQIQILVKELVKALDNNQ